MTIKIPTGLQARPGPSGEIRIYGGRAPAGRREEKLLEQATADYLATAAVPQQPGAHSGLQTVKGREYLVLRNVNGILAVYHVREDGTIAALLSWPSEIRA